MTLPSFHDPREYCLYSDGNGRHIGSNSVEARDWLAAHPEYQGRVYGDFDMGSRFDHFDATELFFGEEAAA